MKITSVDVFVVFCFRTNYVFVQLGTDNHISGFGEATLEMKEQAVHGAICDLKSYLIGQDPFHIGLHWHNIYRDAYWRGGPVLMSALSAIDQALWDIKGKALNVPIYELLGGKFRNSIRAYANGWFSGARTPEEFAVKARKTTAMGFTALKFDPFGTAYMDISNKELAVSLATIHAVQDEVGPEVELLIEGHGRFNVPTAIKISKELELIRNITWFEEPIPPDELDSLQQVRKQTRIPIAFGERLYSYRDFLRLVATGAVDFFQPDISHAGGISELKKIASLAEARYIPISPHNPSGPIACAATLQLAACIPNFTILEFMAYDVPYRKHISNENLVLKDGEVLIPEKHGLGVELNVEHLKKYRYKPVPLRHYQGNLTEIHSADAVPYYQIQSGNHA